MKPEMQRVRVVTYNVHRCRGLDRRVRPRRIVDILYEVGADIIALQEVLSIKGASREADQAHFISEELKLHHALGENRTLRGGGYGNMVLSRFPIRAMRNYNLSVPGNEERGCLRVDLELDNGRLLHIFNVHLGTAFVERRHQARRLTASEILTNSEIKAPRIVLGDFNEWTRGLTTKLLTLHLESVNIRNHLRRSRTYPGVFPFLHLDHVYFDDSLEIEGVTLHRSRKALIASDHLPLVVDFLVPVGEVLEMIS